MFSQETETGEIRRLEGYNTRVFVLFFKCIKQGSGGKL